MERKAYEEKKKKNSKAVSANEKSTQKESKNENKSRVKSARSLYK